MTSYPEPLSLDNDKSFYHHVHRYFTKSFTRCPRITKQDNHFTKETNSSNYLVQFSNFTMVPTKIFFGYKSDFLKDLGNIWLNHYLQNIISQHLKPVLTNEMDFEIIANLKVQFSVQWQDHIRSIEDFYQRFEMHCPICFHHIPEFTTNHNIIELLASHQCENDHLLNLQHHCPCGMSFQDHISFLKHVLPVPVDPYVSLALPICPIATFYWLQIAICSIDTSNSSLNSFYCLICYRNQRDCHNYHESRDKFVKLDFFSWMHHMVFECPSFLQHMALDNSLCYFCLSNQSLSKDLIEPFMKNSSSILTVNFSTFKDLSESCIKNDSDILNCLTTDVNLDLFNVEDFFDFSLDFNLSQKLRPSDFLATCSIIESYNFSKDDLNKVDRLFLNLPYSCSKCLIRFKDLSLKYNHTCYIPRGNNGCKATHVCRCGNLTDNHLAFWNHIFDNCFIVTYLYLVLFCLLKKVNILKCFCDKFFTDSHSLTPFILHWKKCQAAYHIFARHCRHCFNPSTFLNKNNFNSRIEYGSMGDCGIVSYSSNDNNELALLCQKQSLMSPTKSMVANRCQIFSPDNCDEKKFELFSDNFKFACMDTFQSQEQAALIQSTFHILENLSVKIHQKSCTTVLSSNIVDVQTIAAVIHTKIDESHRDNNEPVLNFPREKSSSNLFTINYLDQRITPINIDIKFNKCVFEKVGCVGKINSSVRYLLSRLKSPKSLGTRKGVITEYMEEPPERRVVDHNSRGHFYYKITHFMNRINRKKTESRTPMLPLFRKLASPQYRCDEGILSTRNLRVQYLEPCKESISLNHTENCSRDFDSNHDNINGNKTFDIQLNSFSLA